MKELTHKNICPYYEENCINIGCVCPKYLAFEKVKQDGAIQEQLEKMNIDFNEDKLSIMMSMQSHFSSRFFDLNSLSEKEMFNWIKQYDVCITDELTEAHEHLSIFNDIYGEKTLNIEELQKEFIDIWHFVMDMFHVGKMDTKALMKTYLQTFNLPKLSEKKYLSYFFDIEKKQIKANEKLNVSGDNIDSLSVFILTGHVLAGMRKVRQQISWKHWKKPSNDIDYKKLHEAFVVVFSGLIKCFIAVGINEDRLYEVYVNKNMENIFRQEFGY